MKKYRDWPLITILALALFLRLMLLGLRPTHFDEGIDGWWVDQMITNGFYSYDPLNYHGPFPFYFEFFSKLLFGRNIWALRLPSVAFGFGAVYFLAKMKDFLGKPTAYGAALLMAVSPAMVFFSKYTPHEIGLLFFSVLSCYGYLRFVEWRDKTSLWCLGLGIVGMATTKETFIINTVCFILAVICLYIYERIFKLKPIVFAQRDSFTHRDLFDVSIVSILAFLILYSGVLLHGEGIIDFFRAFANWTKTGTGGNGHDKPFWYWLQNFQRYEIAAFIGLIWCLKVLDPLWWKTTKQAHWVRLFAICGMGTLLAYSIIPYKTPWCIIQLLWPFFIVVANGFEEIATYGKKAKVVALIALGILVSTEAALASRLTFFHTSDESEPYVYVQTFPEIEDVMNKVWTLSEQNSNNYHMEIKIYKEDTWPLPWMLGEYTAISWMGHGSTDNPDAPLILADIALRDSIEAHLKKSYFYRIFKLRSASAGDTIVYFDTEKFSKLIDSSAPRFVPKIIPPKTISVTP